LLAAWKISRWIARKEGNLKASFLSAMDTLTNIRDNHLHHIQESLNDIKAGQDQATEPALLQSQLSAFWRAQCTSHTHIPEWRLPACLVSRPSCPSQTFLQSACRVSIVQFYKVIELASGTMDVQGQVEMLLGRLSFMPLRWWSEITKGVLQNA
jgi:hypothetical protein